MQAAKRVIKSYLGDTIKISVNCYVNGLEGEDLSTAVVEAEFKTPVPVSPTLDVSTMDKGWFTVTVEPAMTSDIVEGQYDLLARVIMPMGEKVTVLDVLVVLAKKSITV